MFTIETLTAFIGWSTVINIAVLLFATIMVWWLRVPITRINTKMFALTDAEVSRAYFQFLAQYKIAIFMFNLVPYIALKIIA